MAAQPGAHPPPPGALLPHSLQADEFAFRLPSLGPLCELRVGHEGRREWHLDRVEVVDSAAGTTYFFPCEQWVRGSGPGGSMSRSLQLRGYMTDPRSLPVQYRVEVAVEEASGVLGGDSLRLTLCGSRGESGAQRLDAARAAPGRTLTAMFEGANVGHMERLRIGLAPGPAGGRGAHGRCGGGRGWAGLRCPALLLSLRSVLLLAARAPWLHASRVPRAAALLRVPLPPRRPALRPARVWGGGHQHAHRRGSHLLLLRVAAQRRPLRF